MEAARRPFCASWAGLGQLVSYGLTENFQPCRLALISEPDVEDGVDQRLMRSEVVLDGVLVGVACGLGNRNHGDDNQHVGVAELFGRPAPPEPNGFLGETQPIQVFVRSADKPLTAENWHTDLTFLERPPVANVLACMKPASLGGDTAWASMYSVYEALSEPVRRLCESVQGEHTLGPLFPLYKKWGLILPQQEDAVSATFPDINKPLVQQHWVTGKPLIFDGGSLMSRIVGLHDHEAAILRDLIERQVNMSEHQFRWRWKAGDVAVWDEHSTQHRGMSDHRAVDPNRVMRACFVMETPYSRPVADVSRAAVHA